MLAISLGEAEKPVYLSLTPFFSPLTYDSNSEIDNNMESGMRLTANRIDTIRRVVREEAGGVVDLAEQVDAFVGGFGLTIPL